MKLFVTFGNNKKRKLKKLSINQIGKRVSYLLQRSFFSVKEILVLKERKALSILHKITKTENIFLSKKERKEVLKTLSLISKKKKVKKIKFISGFLKLFKITKEQIVYKVFTFCLLFINFFNYLFNFRLDCQKIFRN